MYISSTNSSADALPIGMAVNTSSPIVPSMRVAVGVPSFGQCLTLGRGSNGEDSGNCGVTQRSRHYGLADCVQTKERSSAHAKAVGEAEMRCTRSQLSPSSQDQFTAPHPTALSTARRWFTHVTRCSSSETAIGIDRNRLLYGFRKSAAPFPLARSILWIGILPRAHCVLSGFDHRGSRCHRCM